MNNQFQEGQWIRNVKTGEVGKVQFYAEESNYPNGCYYVSVYDTEIFNAKDCELWKPQNDEWCLFWEIESNGNVFPERPFLDKHCGNYTKGPYISTAKMCGCSYWNYCEPFIGRVSDFIQNKN